MAGVPPALLQPLIPGRDRSSVSPSRASAGSCRVGGAMKLRLILLALVSAVAVRAADALPLFNATLTMGKEHRFVLVDGHGKTSSFLALGESFAGYKLKSYDVKEGALELEKEGRVSRVKLVADAATVNAPAAKIPATIADAEVVLNKMKFEEMMERAMQGQKKMLAAQFEKMSTQMAAGGANPAEVAAFQKKITDEVFGVLDPKVLKNDVSKIYSEVFSKQELDQISAFYTTPLGEMLNAKQPEVQEKLGAIIQGRMMEVMPRVQKMGQEFAQQQKAKKAAAAGGAVPAPVPGPKP